MSEQFMNAGEAGLSVPRHIAIILDGNGRWARRRALPRTAGHAAGSENFRKIATYCKNIGVQYLTVYAFSTENWSRPEEEVKAIMKLLDRYLHEAIATIRQKLPRQMRFPPAMTAFRQISASITAAGLKFCRLRNASQEILPTAKSQKALRKLIFLPICTRRAFPILIC